MGRGETMTTLFALFDVNPERIAGFVMNCLAVAGGGLAGFIVVGLMAWFLDRKLTGGKSPPGLHKTVRYVGGVIGAVIVALLVFGSGDGGLGGDQPGGASSASGTNGTGNSSVTSKSTEPTDAPPVPPEELAPKEEPIRITVLSGAAVKEERFYQIESDRTPRNLSDVKDAVAARRKTTKKQLAVEIRLGERTDRNNSGVLDLEGWAIAAGLRVILPGGGK